MHADVLPFRTVPTVTPAESSRPLAVDAKRLAKLLGVGLRSIRTWDAAGKLPSPVRLCGRVLWRLNEIEAWLKADCPDRQTWTAQSANFRR